MCLLYFACLPLQSGRLQTFNSSPFPEPVIKVGCHQERSLMLAEPGSVSVVFLFPEMGFHSLEKQG